MRKVHFYFGNAIMGYRLFTPNLLEARGIGTTYTSKPISNNERSIDYNCDKKLLKTTYRKRRKVQLPNSEVVINTK